MPVRQTQEYSARSWKPQSNGLKNKQGIWMPATNRRVSYPEEGNEIYFQVEDTSYWFAHRNRCIVEMMRQFPPGGTIYDIGGGNGFVSIGLQTAGFETVLVEPGAGALNAWKRGVQNVVQSALEDAGFHENMADAVGAFDVVEHIEDHGAFLRQICRLLRPGGRFYCTVPAMPLLWSDEDDFAGHFRRYSVKTLRAAIEKTGMQVEFISGLFSWLVLPVFLFRTLPFCLRVGKKETVGNKKSALADHRLPCAISTLASVVHNWELKWLQEKRPIFFGSSLLCVARRPVV
jgi:SAM-dependent methyltransferase